MRWLCVVPLVAVLGCGPGEGWDSTIEGQRRPDVAQEAAAAAQAMARSALGATAADKSILFGDLHVHTSYSWDGFMFTLPAFGGEGAHPPADACDFARYCSQLDFFALTDHAEAMRPEHWEASKESVRECNARAGDAANPDLVAFMGFEWTQAGLTPESHWGHRCLFFPGTADDELPARPIASSNRNAGYARMRGMLGMLRWIQPQDWGAYANAVDHLAALTAREECAADVPSPELPSDCLEVAPDPARLHAKLDEWGLDVIEIPHGTAWGVYTPATTTIDKHLDVAHYDAERMRAIEVMSGHGNSEEYRSWRHWTREPDGSRTCPAPTPDFLPCCWQAGEIIRSRCGDLPADECEARVEEARQIAMEIPAQPTKSIPDAEPEEWLDCGQCRDCFKPSYGYRPLESVQYAMALTNHDAPPTEGRPLRFRYGFIGSSDIHDARAGAGYKQIDAEMMTDGGTRAPLLELLGGLMAPGVEDPTRAQRPKPGQAGLVGNDARVQDYLFPSGLAAVHSTSRSREAIWDALQRREVYGTSGPRILLWFDLLNGAQGRAPMGSEHVLAEAPRFEVRAAGSFEPRPGCADWAERGLSAERLDWLCRGECHHPGDVRRRIERIDVIRIRPRVSPDEPIDALIEDPWRSFPCPDDPAGCVVRFDDPDFVGSARDALYYARAVEVPSQGIHARPLNPTYDANGNAISIERCGGDLANPDCLAETRERAWSSPIFVDQPRSTAPM